MKNLKTTIKLSVLALACLGAGALALQPTAYAQADTTNPNPADCLTMANGASVSVKDDFSGIRWETKINYAKYAALKEANPDATITFGTLVMPTKMLSDDDDDDGVLTDADIDVNSDKGALDLPANVVYENLTADTTYYSVVDFNEVAEGKEAAAYAMELTARSYVKIGDAYHFVDLGTTNTSRSARQVALSAELDGELTGDKATAVEYFGGEHYEVAEENTGAAGTAFIDLNNGATPEQPVVVNDFVIEGTIQEVIVGAEKVEYTYADNTLTLNIKAGQNFPTGEKYVAVFTDKGIYTKPIICATMVITDTKGLEIFNAKGDDDENSTKVKTEGWKEKYWNPEQEQSGYYVLGGDIDAIGYVHGSKNTDGTFNNSSWNGATSYRNMPIGLTGTFNGLGYSINNMEMGSEREGLFGIVNGGTVKNVGFIDVQATGGYKFVLANFLYKAKVENVYIKTDEYVADADGDGVAESMGFPMAYCAGLSNYASGNTTLNSLFIHYAKANSDGEYTGVMFNAYNAGFTAEDVYCVSDNVVLGQYTHTLMFVEKTSSFDVEDKENYNVTKRIWLAENEQSRKCTDGSVLNFVPAKYEYTLDEKTGRPSEGYTAPDNNTNKKVGKYGLLPDDLKVVLYGDITRPRVVMMGALRYNSVDAMIKYDSDHSYYNTAITEGMSYKNLANTGCWYLDGSNNLVWGQNPNA